MDENKCIGCGICTTKCEFDAIHLHRDHPECSKMTRSEDKFIEIGKYMAGQSVKTAASKIPVIKKYAESAAKQAGTAAEFAKKQAQTAGRKLKNKKK